MSAHLYVVQTRPGRESRAKVSIEASTRSADQRHPIDVLWPRRELIHRRRGRTQRVRAAIFPGYLFVRAGELTADTYRIVRGIDDVVRFLGDDGSIVRALPDYESAPILRLTRDGDLVTASRVTFGPDQRIVVHSGPMKGLEGLITKVDRRRQRARVRLDVYQDAFLVDLGFAVLESTPTPEGSLA